MIRPGAAIQRRPLGEVRRQPPGWIVGAASASDRDDGASSLVSPSSSRPGARSTSRSGPWRATAIALPEQHRIGAPRQGSAQAADPPRRWDAQRQVGAGLARSDHRTDIDGLRGIAVLSVILYHVDARLLPGGFVGVDVFFVISGYLISRNVLRQAGEGRFSLSAFYQRRVKRIAPALLVVIAATLVLSHVLMRPEGAEQAAESALWSVLCLPNVYFFLHQGGGYFAAASAERPLLHLWSLGVEEQFYLLWPPLLAAVARARLLLPAAAAAALYSSCSPKCSFHSILRSRTTCCRPGPVRCSWERSSRRHTPGTCDSRGR